MSKDITLNEDFEIKIRFEPKENMRYDTLGDYRWDQGQLLVQINNDMPFIDRMAILIHELAEWAIVHRDKIPIAKVDEWDMSHPDSEEPGEEPECPYGYAHTAAMVVENAFRTWADLTEMLGKESKVEEDSAARYLKGFGS